MDINLENVSIELLQLNGIYEDRSSLARLDFIQSQLSFESFSNQTKTTNLSCESFLASDTRNSEQLEQGSKKSVFKTVLAQKKINTADGSKINRAKLQFELHYNAGPDFMHMTALLVDMRVYLIFDWLSDAYNYLIENPADEWCDILKKKSSDLIEQYNQVIPGQPSEDDPDKKDIRFKVNVTNTDFVVVEDCSRHDSDGIILRSTAVLHHAPNIFKFMKENTLPSTVRNNNDKPLICTLQSVEVFSCQLDQEEQTALSIVDPVLVNLEVDLLNQSDLSDEEIMSHPQILDMNKLDVHISDLHMRVSYNDLILFLQIAKSLPFLSKENKNSQSNSESTSVSSSTTVIQPPPEFLSSLMELGYTMEDVTTAYMHFGANVTSAANWLMENAKLVPVNEPTPKPEQKLPFNIGKVLLNIEQACICLIDDCAENCDVPLAELALRDFNATQCLIIRPITPDYSYMLGKSKFILTGDYYNRTLSLWEPYIEPWRCSLKWNFDCDKNSCGLWHVKVEPSDRLDLTITSTFIETLQTTSETWTKSYSVSNKDSKEQLVDVPRPFHRKRQAFIPYILRNLTGLPLKFATITAYLRGSNLEGNLEPPPFHTDEWMKVMPGDNRPFVFGGHQKQRHKRSDQLSIHQIAVKVGECQTLTPVTISKVGVYFRHATEEIIKSSSVYKKPDPIRVVFAVTLEGSAQKIVTVRSALVVRSKIKVPVQVQLIQPITGAPFCLPLLEPGEVQYVPLNLSHCDIRLKPHPGSGGAAYRSSSSSISWKRMPQNQQIKSKLINCSAVPLGNQSNDDFRFAICMKRKSYPSYEEVVESLSSNRNTSGTELHDLDYIPPLMPGHTIVILPPIIISNLLPCELHYYFKGLPTSGKLRPGQDATIHTLHLSDGSNKKPLYLGCGIEGFLSCDELVIPHVQQTKQMRMTMVDHKNRKLLLNVRVIWRYGCSVKISIMAGYWIVNKTGLPLIFQQDGSREHAAGQYDEHESARSMAPLLFSYSNRDLAYLCTMRLGKYMPHEYDSPACPSKYPHQTGPRLSPFCQSFSIDGGTCTRNLMMVSRSNSPNLIYHVGISVRQGWGRFSNTHIVTVAPRFLLVNLTQNLKLSFAQRHTISYSQDSSGLNQHLNIIPGSSVVFHWSRVDLDRLLCVRLTDNNSCRWSGGFVIDKISSFYINLRIYGSNTAPEHCVFLRVEITLVDATYRVAFHDADNNSSPPPLRIDNLAEAPLIFRQESTDEGLTTEVAAESQLPYACDEPCYPPLLKCAVKGGSTYVLMDMNKIGSEQQLTYQNYIYIAMAYSAGSKDDELVLEVAETSYDHSVDGTGQDIILGRKRPGNRRQLWRMNHRSQLVSVGVNLPGKHPGGNDLVLDIAENSFGPQVGGVPLCIRQPDARREHKQKWQFTKDGRLSCGVMYLCVQATSLQAGSRAVLGSFQEEGIALPNQRFYPEKMIAGSGILVLSVVRDGPTRVLRVSDIRQNRGPQSKATKDGWVLVDPNSKNPPQPQSQIQINVEMPKGVGVSLVNSLPEELVYMTFTGVRMEILSDEKEQSIRLRVQNFQVDNQLLESRRGVMVYRYISSGKQKGSSSATDPFCAIFISAVKLSSASKMYEIYKELTVEIAHMCLVLEEVLLLKLVKFFGGGFSSDAEQELLDETKMDLINSNATSAERVPSKKRYYIDFTKISCPNLQLSVLRDQLSPELKEVKQALSLTLIQFERAPVDMQPFVKKHMFEAFTFITNSLLMHFKDQLKGQAAKILGSIDFLGNPIGLLSDLSDGMSDLAKGNVQNLVKRVTHGLSNSTAKFTGSLSNQLGNISMDKEYTESRRQLRASTEKSGDHLVAGLQGLGAGLVGGLTSIVTQTVKGTQNDGAKGFFTGFGKGLVGTVTKPVTGVLDFASETASAVRESSESQFHNVAKIRPPRCCHSFRGCLQCYSRSRADNQEFLYSINHSNKDEWLYNTFVISSQEDLKLLITNKRVMLVKQSNNDYSIQLEAYYNNLITSRAITEPSGSDASYRRGSCFLELTLKPIANLKLNKYFNFG